MTQRIGLCVVALGLIFGAGLSGQEKKTTGKVPEGHSHFGEAFNEGPRQRAYLIGGTGNIRFPVTTKNPLVQQFVEQGIGQLHGFWYFEAERSFRQAAKLDPDCAIAYWGMAKANKSNRKRAKGFIAEAVKRKHRASRREQMYIDSLNQYLTAKGGRTQKARAYVKAVKAIATAYPNDLEAEALLGYLYWSNRKNVRMKYEQVDAHLKQVLQKAPFHPVHHYIIHLWDYKNPKLALRSAARCGQGTPSIAHMWHMPGHTYSRLKRYGDAVWQQEASARVDHQQMMRDRILPDQIHNFAHNNEWLIRNLIFIGRWRDALDLAKNMIELPRHPKYNTMKKRRSSYYGRKRLFDVLAQFELWEETISLSNSTHLEPTTIANEQINRLKLLGIAYFRSGDDDNGAKILRELEQRLAKARAKQKRRPPPKSRTGQQSQPIGNGKQKAAKSENPRKNKTQPKIGGQANPGSVNPKKKASNPTDQPKESKGATAGTVKKKTDSPKNKTPMKSAKTAAPKTKGKTAGQRPKQQKRSAGRRRPVSQTVRTLQQAVDALKGHRALADDDYREALTYLRKGRADARLLARVQALSGDIKGAVKAAQSHARSRPNQVLPQATLVEILWRAGNKEAATKEFDKLRKMSGYIQFGSPVFARLEPIAKHLECGADWRIAAKRSTDVGVRPNLDDIGPFRWQPQAAPKWNLRDASGAVRSLADYRGKPVVVIFYLGYGCLHCAEQLKAFAPKTAEFAKAGISLVGISTDDRDGLKNSLNSQQNAKFPFPLVSDAKLEIFKDYRAFDDFENIPLHGTFLIDADGRVRWQDISYEPFMDVDFVLRESRRLLGLARVDNGSPVSRVKRIFTKTKLTRNKRTSLYPPKNLANNNWPRFRGSNGAGVSSTIVPVDWTDKDFAWKTSIAGKGYSSPVIWGDRVFLTSSNRKNGARLVFCVHAATGKVLWRQVFKGATYRMHRRNSGATSTPAVDGQRLYLAWATPDALTVMALDHGGKLRWQKNLGRYKGNHGFGVSPIVYKDLVVLANDQDRKGSLLALDSATGKIRWNIPRKSGNATYSTPCVYRHNNGKEEIIFTNWKHGMTAVNPATGKINWEISIFEPNKKERAIASPVVAGDLILGTCGFVTRQKHFVAVKPPAHGSKQKPKEMWRIERDVSYLPTPLIKDNLVFLCTEQGIASCLRADSGKVVWQKRIGEKFYASPVCAGNRIYCVSTDGDVFVLAASAKFQVLARNSLGEGSQSTPALAHGRIYFRTEGHLICLGGRK